MCCQSKGAQRSIILLFSLMTGHALLTRPAYSSFQERKKKSFSLISLITRKSSPGSKSESPRSSKSPDSKTSPQLARNTSTPAVVKPAEPFQSPRRCGSAHSSRTCCRQYSIIPECIYDIQDLYRIDHMYIYIYIFALRMTDVANA